MPLPRAFLLITVLSLFLHAHAETPGKEELFQKGLAAYQSKQYAEARDDFQKLLDQGTMNASVLHNLALAAYQLDQKPFALALWRKALMLEPGFRPAKVARDNLESKMNMRPLERDSFSLWAHRELESLSLYQLLWLNALFLAVAGFMWLRYFGDRGSAIEEERPLPEFPTIPLIVGIVFLASVSLVVLKAKDVFTPRATVTGLKVSARSLPADDSVSLFDLSGGSEVLVRRQQSGWTQVQNGDGASGWVKDAEIFVTSER
jgi:hypothetical protein